MRILYVTTIGTTMTFFNSFIKVLLDKGHTVDIATNEDNGNIPVCYREWGCRVYQIDTSRSPFSMGNWKAIRQVKKLVEEQKYEIVHCHTPLASMCTRLACRKVRKHGTKVIYTAHGFHFYKGAPLRNWLLYYPVEKICAHFTDVLITINQEDYALAQKKMRAKRVEYIPGVGIDLERFSFCNVDKIKKRIELGIPLDSEWILNVGELIPRKNQETLIRAVAKIDDTYLTIAGQGELMNYLNGVICELKVENRVKLLGFRTDISELCRSCDIFAFPSFQEGLPVSVMEAMASGLPVVCSKIRGNIDLIDANGGVLFNPQKTDDCKEAIEKLFISDKQQMGAYNKEKIKKCSLKAVNEQMYEILLKDNIK